jgi:hypothetical protein
MKRDEALPAEDDLRSEYDLGHLRPCAENTWSATAPGPTSPCWHPMFARHLPRTRRSTSFNRQ